MKEIIGDLRAIDEEDGDILADHGIVQELEGVLLDYIGKVVRIKIYEVAPSRLKGKPNGK